MNRQFLIPFFLILFLQLRCSSESTDVSQFFVETTGAFVLYDLNNDTYIRYNEQRCTTRYSPCSTFKIPNSLREIRILSVLGLKHIIKGI